MDFANHIDDILGRGEPDALSKSRASAEYRFGSLKAQEKFSRAHGHRIAPGGRLLGRLEPGGVYEGFQIFSRLSSDEIKVRECKLGELCWVATISRPGICSRLARY